jgi:hypothetical protein
VIQWYGKVTTRTVLQHRSLSDVSITLRARPANELEAGAAIEKALAAKGVRFIPDGSKFVMVVPEAHAAGAHPHSSALEPSDPMIPKGEVNFPFMDVYQTFDFYAILVGRKLVQPDEPIPNGPLIFYNETPLSKNEVCYALDTLFAWNGVKIVKVRDDKLRLESIPYEESRVLSCERLVRSR